MLRTYPKLLVVLLIFSTNIFSQTQLFDVFATDCGSKKYSYFSSGNIISDIEKGLFVIRHSGTLNTEDLILNKLFIISPNPTINNHIINITQNQRMKRIEVFRQKIFFKDNINLQEFVLPITDYKNGISMN